VNPFHKQWLSTVPWETVLSVNQALCQAQNTPHQPKDKACVQARQVWEKAVPQPMSLPEVLDVCRRCHELAPFRFNNGNTFAAISKTLVEDWLKRLPPVEAQIIRTTVAHYVAGQVGKKELLQVLRHFETTWKTAEQTKPAAPTANKPAPHLSAAEAASPRPAGT
jgi:hypothetical protein